MSEVTSSPLDSSAPRRLARLEAGADDAVQDQELGAEALRLPARQAGELRAPDALHEPEEVLDHRGVASLAARQVLLGDRRGEPVGGAVHRRREAGRPAAHDHQVVVRLRGPRVDVPRLGQALNVDAGVDRVAVDHHRQLSAARAGLRQHRLGLRRARLVELVRLRRARQEVTQAVVLRLQPVTHHVYRRAGRAHGGSLRPYLLVPGWRNSVRRDRLKPDCPRGRVGSNPTPGTSARPGQTPGQEPILRLMGL